MCEKHQNQAFERGGSGLALKADAVAGGCVPVVQGVAPTMMLPHPAMYPMVQSAAPNMAHQSMSAPFIAHQQNMPLMGMGMGMNGGLVAQALPTEMGLASLNSLAGSTAMGGGRGYVSLVGMRSLFPQAQGDSLVMPSKEQVVEQGQKKRHTDDVSSTSFGLFAKPW